MDELTTCDLQCVKTKGHIATIPPLTAQIPSTIVLKVLIHQIAVNQWITPLHPEDMLHLIFLPH